MPGQLAGVVLVVLSFFLGSIPWGYLAAKGARGIDLRAVGSGGTGATNVWRTLGASAAASVFILDFLKGLVPVVLARSLGFASLWVAVAAAAAVAGHCWSPFISFKGGKGVATGAGAAAGLFPPVLVALPLAAVAVWATRYVSLGSLVATMFAATLAILSAVSNRVEWPPALAILAMSVIIVVRHEGNVRRLLNGTERRIGDTLAV